MTISRETSQRDNMMMDDYPSADAVRIESHRNRSGYASAQILNPSSTTDFNSAIETVSTRASATPVNPSTRTATNDDNITQQNTTSLCYDSVVEVRPIQVQPLGALHDTPPPSADYGNNSSSRGFIFWLKRVGCICGSVLGLYLGLVVGGLVFGSGYTVDEQQESGSGWYPTSQPTGLSSPTTTPTYGPRCDPPLGGSNGNTPKSPNGYDEYLADFIEALNCRDSYLTSLPLDDPYSEALGYILVDKSFLIDSTKPEVLFERFIMLLLQPVLDSQLNWPDRFFFDDPFFCREGVDGHDFSCNDKSRITRISNKFSDNDPSPLPTEIGLLTLLTDVDLARNEITGTIPTEIGMLTDLTNLNLAGNEFTGQIPSQIGLLTNLEVLTLNVYSDLNHNSLTGTVPDTMSALSRLTQLNLNGHETTSGNLDGLCSNLLIPILCDFRGEIYDTSITCGCCYPREPTIPRDC